MGNRILMFFAALSLFLALFGLALLGFYAFWVVPD